MLIKNLNYKTILRKKNIVVEDSLKAFLPQHKQSKILTCRNPFKQDDQLINYDLDTEDELEEENGEDLDEDNKMSDDDENDLQEEELQEGFIVEDDCFSLSEMNYSETS